MDQYDSPKSNIVQCEYKNWRSYLWWCKTQNSRRIAPRISIRPRIHPKGSV